MSLQLGDRVQVRTARDGRNGDFPLGFPANGQFGTVRYVHTQKPCEFGIRVDLDNGHLDGFSLHELTLVQKKSIRIPIRAKAPEPAKKIRIALKPVKRVKIKLRRN